MKHAYVTLVTNPDFALGALVLAKSLQRTGAKAPLLVLHTPAMDGEVSRLSEQGCQLLKVDMLPLSEEFKQRHGRKNLHAAAPFDKGGKPEFHNPLNNFLKLHLWNLEQYDKIVFLDADTLVLQNIDNLFDFPEFSGAPNLYESLDDMHRLNSGVFVAKPNAQTFDHMLKALDKPDIFWRRTDQTFLQHYFPNWHNLPYTYNCLQYVWINLPQLWVWDSIKLVHYQYEKPWADNHPKAQELAIPIELWQRIYYDVEISSLFKVSP